MRFVLVRRIEKGGARKATNEQIDIEKISLIFDNILFSSFLSFLVTKMSVLYHLNCMVLIWCIWWSHKAYSIKMLPKFIYINYIHKLIIITIIYITCQSYIITYLKHDDFSFAIKLWWCILQGVRLMSIIVGSYIKHVLWQHL